MQISFQSVDDDNYIDFLPSKPGEQFKSWPGLIDSKIACKLYLLPLEFLVNSLNWCVPVNILGLLHTAQSKRWGRQPSGGLNSLGPIRRRLSSTRKHFDWGVHKYKVKLIDFK